MTSSNTIANVTEKDEQKRMRRMALATTTASIEGMTLALLMTYIILYASGLVIYLGFHNTTQVQTEQLITAMATTWYLTWPAIPVITTIILFTCYTHATKKARKLKKMKEHEFLITFKSQETCDISGTMTIAGAKVKYSTHLYEEELEAFEQL